MGEYYDALETRSSDERETQLFSKLSEQLAYAKNKSAAYAGILKLVNPEKVKSRSALAKLPVTRKSDLIDRQRKNPPFGGLAVASMRELVRVYASPGPIYEPEGKRNDYFRMARALAAAGFKRGELVHNTFSYHFTPAGFMLESGAQALGCAVFPAGVGQTELQVKAIADLKPQGYVGTPSFLKIILDKAKEDNVNVSSIKKALVSGEGLPPGLRDELKRDGVAVLQCYATADVGLIAYESPALEGMILDENIIVEIVKPGTGEPVEDGETGEVLVTTFNADYPLIRFATGDLSAVLAGASPCGRTNTRIKGWMGRADQTTKIRGMFVHPGQIVNVLTRHPEVNKARLVVARDGVNDAMILKCESEAGDSSLQAAITESIRAVCKLRGEVEFVGVGELPDDGKVIDDVRTY